MNNQQIQNINQLNSDLGAIKIFPDYSKVLYTYTGSNTAITHVVEADGVLVAQAEQTIEGYGAQVLVDDRTICLAHAPYGNGVDHVIAMTCILVKKGQTIRTIGLYSQKYELNIYGLQ